MNFVDTIRSYRPFWRLITLTAEPILMIPLGIVIFVWLWASCSRRTAFVWGGQLAVGGGLIVAQKLLYYMAGVSLDSIRLYSVSGHSFTASYMFGTLVVILCASWPRALRYVAGFAILIFVLLIGVSRVALFGHRIAEAVVGLALGAGLLFIFLKKSWRYAKPRLSAWTLALPSAVVMIAMYGRVFEIETIFRSLGRWARPGVNFYR